ncbi:MAG: TRAP transporter fused permease subunit [Gemmatimonadetes bacterium]|nr:TRAP transporter fused permease subunit [Gemmatimonadota bacterium]
MNQQSRRPELLLRRACLALAIGAALFHMYAAGISPFTALVQRPVHFGLMAVLGFLGLGTTRRSRSDEDGGRRVLSPVLTAVLIAAVVATCAYMVVEQEALVRRSGAATGLDIALGAVAVLVVLELARRATGWGLVAVASLALVYAWAGPYLPGALAHRGYGPRRLIEHLYLTTEGIWGVPLGVSADFVYLFVLFGAMLEVAGGGGLLIALAARIAGRTRGGPAKTAAMASAIMGSLSGSAVANVVTTGSLTIPLMKRTGFRPHFAAAIEAAASTGGQLMPPVMGAGAFILATWTGIPYVRVAAAAAIPAVLYYLALYMAIHFRAGKSKLETLESDTSGIRDRLHLLLPLGVIVALLAMGRSPMRAAFWGVTAAVAATLATRATRLDRHKLSRAIMAAAGGTVQVAGACAAAGIVVGVASLTGIGLRMSELIVRLSGGHLPIALGLTAVGSIVLGMGLPTTAAYIVLAALGAPALTELGVPLLGAHLFIFYFGCMSNITPPVALAAYAAAGLAGSGAMRTAVTALGLGSAGFVVPFLFIYDPALILQGLPLAILASGTAVALGLTAMASGVIGYSSRSLPPWMRGSLLVGAAALFVPSTTSRVIGLVIVAGTWTVARQASLVRATEQDQLSTESTGTGS